MANYLRDVKCDPRPGYMLEISTSLTVRGWPVSTEHLVRLSRWSESKTLTLFSQVYQRMAVLAREPIHRLYADIVSYLDAPGPPGPDATAWLSSPPHGPSMADSVTRFFAKLFPLTFHTTVAPAKRVSHTMRRAAHARGRKNH